MSKSNTKTLAVLLLLIIGSSMSMKLAAQQDHHFSQYMFNRLVINPAYAGNQEALSITSMYRHQWTGFAGAPRSLTVSAHMPSKNLRNGFGISIFQDRTGPKSSEGFSLQYAYRIHLKNEATLSLGLQGECSMYGVDYARIRQRDQNDPILDNNSFRKFTPNAGTGVWYREKEFFAGVSVPRLIPSRLSVGDAVGDSRRKLHFFGMAGYLFRLSDHVKLMPSAMIKLVPQTPVSIDFNLSFLLKETVWVGATYRTDQTLVLMSQVFLNSWLRMGYSYDIHMSEVRAAQTGSHEFMLRADLNFVKNKLRSPRYF